MINSCMLCGLCEEVCPEDFAVQELCLTARQEMVEKGQMPPSAHEFALRDMHFANTKAIIAKNAPDATTSTYAFFPGCQMPAISPELVENTYQFLQTAMQDPVGLFVHCCGAPAHWAGQQDTARSTCETITMHWESLGKPKLITGCPTCANIFAELMPHIPTCSLWEIFQQTGLPDSAKRSAHQYVLHDPCSTRHDEPMREHVRSILAELELNVVEPELTGKLTECCGYGGLLDNANPKLSKKVSETRANNLAAASEETRDVLTYCAMCRDMLARTGTPTVQLLDILFPQQNACCSAEHKPVFGYSDRRENRIRLKEHMLKTYWNELYEREEKNAAISISGNGEARHAGTTNIRK